MVDGCAARATAQLTDEVKILGPAAPPAGGAAETRGCTHSRS